MPPTDARRAVGPLRVGAARLKSRAAGAVDRVLRYC